MPNMCHAHLEHACHFWGKFQENSCSCRGLVCRPGSARCALVGGVGGWPVLTTVTCNNMDHPQLLAAVAVMFDYTDRVGGVRMCTKRVLCVGQTRACIMLVHMCVAWCACLYCPTLAQSAAPTKTSPGMHMPHTCCHCCARRMASGLASRRHSGHRLHSTQSRHRGVLSASEGVGGWVHLNYCRRPAAASGSGGRFIRKQGPEGC